MPLDRATLHTWLHHWQDEADAAYLYLVLAGQEPDQKRKDVYIKLAGGGTASLPDVGAAPRRARRARGAAAPVAERASQGLVRAPLRSQLPAAAAAARGGAGGQGIHGPPQGGQLRGCPGGFAPARQGIGGACRDPGGSRRSGGGALAQDRVGGLPAQRGLWVQRWADGQFPAGGGRDRRRGRA